MDIQLLVDLWNTNALARSTMLIVGGVLASFLTRLIFAKLLLRLTRRTSTDLDDILVHGLGTPIFASILTLAVWFALHPWMPADTWANTLKGVLMTTLLMIWTVSLSRASRAMLDWLVEHQHKHQIISRRTLPVFDVSAKTLIYGGTLYLLFLAWSIDPTAWLASAGVIGLAVGFAAQDTLANLVSGLSILADAPYKLGDFLILDTGERGYVTEIGVRATRLMTLDDVEVIIPNAVMAGARIVNQSGGPEETFRLRLDVGVAYGSDIDLVRSTLITLANGHNDVVYHPSPICRFRAFGDSSLDFQLLAWVDNPRKQEAVVDALNSAIYKKFAELDIEIPYPKRDVYLYNQPSG